MHRRFVDLFQIIRYILYKGRIIHYIVLHSICVSQKNLIRIQSLITILLNHFELGKHDRSQFVFVHIFGNFSTCLFIVLRKRKCGLLLLCPNLKGYN